MGNDFTDIDWFTSLSASVQMCRYLLVPACIGVTVCCSPLCTPSLYQSVNIILLSGQFPSLTTGSLDTGIVSPQQQHFRHTGTLPTTHHISSLSAQSFLGLLYLNAQCYYFLGWLLKQVIWVICVTQFREDRDKFKIYPKKMYISRPV